jgi:hypothetical protein
VPNFRFWPCGIFWQICHKIIMLPCKDINGWCVCFGKRHKITIS